MKHKPFIAHAPRLGAWCICPCGWHSRYSYTTITGAHLAFGAHLLEANR